MSDTHDWSGEIQEASVRCRRWRTSTTSMTMNTIITLSVERPGPAFCEMYIGLIRQLFTATLAMEYGDDLDLSDAMKRKNNLARIFIQPVLHRCDPVADQRLHGHHLRHVLVTARNVERAQGDDERRCLCAAPTEGRKEYDIDKEEHEGSEHNK